MKKIILASTSTRRKEILENLGLEFEVYKSDVEEKVDKYLTFEENVERIALEKALKAAEELKNEDSLIIAAHTMLIYDNLIGMPSTEQEAFDILQQLSGKVHEIITGVCVFDTSENRGMFTHKKTKVKFMKLRDDFIRRFINEGETWQKAGAYSVVGKGALLVDEIEGCYTNVMGLPISLLGEMLVEFDMNII
ncbi:nucleoside triphosphate pyrophosphatase [Alkalibacter saccharofermentans]|uniref:Nucleoside triphosphate pyrophosphatase n=1 Tax=Alkalibacter saccharofermentans DSM 14828 TaxID=1120975 RepID=A0A1M4VFF6_9FIRM|nr:Maf family protein [Alkalibacter saccharofermentans]SHE67746.1 septum formation protein [Alkalibacter saccharofermentans DSM 14828]